MTKSTYDVILYFLSADLINIYNCNMSTNSRTKSTQIILTSTIAFITQRVTSLGYIPQTPNHTGPKTKLLGENTFLYQTQILQQITLETPLELIFFTPYELRSLHAHLSSEYPHIYQPGINPLLFNDMLTKSLSLLNFHDLICI